VTTPIRATYRLQLHAGFTFDDAAAAAKYLADLNVTHAYCSPYLQAAEGSTHGYDVLDHSTLNRELGGEVLGRAAQRAGSDALAFLADTFAGLPRPTATDRGSVRRRHRDREVLRRLLERSARLGRNRRDQWCGCTFAAPSRSGEYDSSSRRRLKSARKNSS
jgi:hypothetical protein